jgi:hypothetical protein
MRIVLDLLSCCRRLTVSGAVLTAGNAAARCRVSQKVIEILSFEARLSATGTDIRRLSP